MDFAHLLPQARPWVENLRNVWPAPIIKPQFAWWEVGHIISLFMLSGCLLLINLRLLGAGLTSEKASTIEKNLRPYLLVGVAGVVITGILIGMTNAEKLYGSTAFVVKMIAMFAGIAFTYGVTVPIAKADGKLSGPVKAVLLISFAAWALSVWVFAVAGGINPGTIHITIAAAFLVFMATTGRTRLVFAGGFLAILLVQQVVTHGFIAADNYALLNPVNIWFSRIEAVWVTAFVAWEILGQREPRETGALVRLSAYASLLIWVTAAAAGRWIAYA